MNDDSRDFATERIRDGKHCRRSGLGVVDEIWSSVLTSSVRMLIRHPNGNVEYIV